MADIYDEFVTYLKAQAGVTNLVGTTTAARIFPDVPRQKTARPFLVLVEGAGGQTEEHLGGLAGFAETVMHVYAYADSRTAANALAEAVRLAGPLQTFRGTMGSTHCSAVSASGNRDTGIDLPTDTSDRKRYWVRRTYFIHHQEAVS